MADNYTVELRNDQWDLVLLCLEHVRQMANNAVSNYAVDTVCRKFTKHRIDEVVTDIKANVPEAE